MGKENCLCVHTGLCKTQNKQAFSSTCSRRKEKSRDHQSQVGRFPTTTQLHQLLSFVFSPGPSLKRRQMLFSLFSPARKRLINSNQGSFF